MSNYEFTLPQSYSNDAVKEFLINFYKVSDSRPPTENDPYVDYFTSNAYVKIGPNEGIGHDDIAKNRFKSWDGIASRKHTIFQVYPHSKDSDKAQDIAVYGDVEYTKTDGTVSFVEWAGRFILSVENGTVKGTDYRVFIGPKPTLIKN